MTKELASVLQPIELLQLWSEKLALVQNRLPQNNQT
jgi:hypothetical protein